MHVWMSVRRRGAALIAGAVLASATAGVTPGAEAAPAAPGAEAAPAASTAPAAPAVVTDAPPAVPGLAPAAPPLPMIETVAQRGKLNEPAFVKTHDKGQSTLYDNGAGLRFSYWSFGDTGIDAPSPLADYNLGNTATRLTDFDLSNNVENVASWDYDNDGPANNNLPREAFPLPPGYSPSQFRVWGGSTVADPERHRMMASTT